MTYEKSAGTARTPQIALVGTTRAGKSVFTTVLAKYLERPREGVRLSPRGGRPKSTFAQIDEWWSVLQGGNWLPATTPGTLIELQWDLCFEKKKIPLRMFDYAGEILTDLFSGKKDDATGAAKEFFDKVRAVFDSATVLLVLINLESFIEKDVTIAGESKGTLVTAMSTFLENNKREGRSCRVCFVFTAYDQYESVILSRWGSVKNFLEQEIPPLFYEFVDANSNVKFLPVAAINETETRIDPHTGKALRYPKPGAGTAGFAELIKWLAEAVGDSKIELDIKANEAAQDEKNATHVEQLAHQWNQVSGTDQLATVDRFLKQAWQNLPCPNGQNAAKLESQRLGYLNAANDLRAEIKRLIIDDRIKNGVLLFKYILPIISGIGLLWLILAYAVPAYQNYQTARAIKTQQDIDNTKIKIEQQKLEPPQPKVNEWTWGYICDKGIFDCWEHRARARVSVVNNGGRGNVTVIFTIGNKTASEKVFLNRGETSDVYVTVYKLPNHDLRLLEGSILLQTSK